VFSFGGKYKLERKRRVTEDTEDQEDTERSGVKERSKNQPIIDFFKSRSSLCSLLAL